MPANQRGQRLPKHIFPRHRDERITEALDHHHHVSIDARHIEGQLRTASWYNAPNNTAARKIPTG